MTAPSPKLNVSLELHAAELLKSIIDLVPEDLHQTLIPYTTTDDLPSIIPYEVLSSVSRWARTASGISALKAQKPPINPQDCSMVSLLAGALTSPDRNFPPPKPVKEPEEIAAEQQRERKAIAALINSLFSIIGAGLAGWWAADKTGWKNEWRVLFALFVAVVVAIAEGVLFLIWQRRRTSTSKPPTRKQISTEKKDEKEELQGDITGEGEVHEVGGVQVHESADLRKRRPQS